MVLDLALLLLSMAVVSGMPTEQRHLQNLDGWDQKCLPYCLGRSYEIDGVPRGISALWGEEGRCNTEFHTSVIISDFDGLEDCPMNCHMVCCMANGIEDLSHCNVPE